MALKNVNTTSAAFETPDFEDGAGFNHDDFSGDVAVAAPAVAAPVAVPVAAPVVAQVAQTVAAAAPGILLHALQDKITLDAAKRIAKAGGSAAGKISAGDRNSPMAFGGWVEGIPVSFYHQWVVNPNKGATLDEEERKLQKFGGNDTTSYDGVNFAQYIEDLKTQGYKKACLDRRLILLMYVTDAENKAGTIAKGGKEPVLFYLPLTSLNSWTTLVERQKVEVEVGIAEPIHKVRAQCESFKSKDNKSYSAVTFAAC